MSGIENWMHKNRRLVTFILVSVLTLVLGSRILNLSSIGFQTAYQGLQTEFAAVYFRDRWCSPSEQPDLSDIPYYNSYNAPGSWMFGGTLDFDPDNPEGGWPDLCASQQPITLVSDQPSEIWSWTVDKGTIQLSNGSAARKVVHFTLYRYEAVWRMNIWLTGSTAEAAVREWHGGIKYEYNYAGTEIWVRLTPKAFVYFRDNPDELYFAPAYVGVENVVLGSKKEQTETRNDPDMSYIDLIPKARGETLPIYYKRGGTPVNVEDVILSYEGTELDPSVFRDEYWVRIKLIEFRPWNHIDFLTKAWSYKFPSVWLEFKVHLFVVGKWTVYLKQGEVPDLDPHRAPEVIVDPWSWLPKGLSWLRGILESPWTWIGLGFFGILMIAVVVIIVMFWLFGMPRGGRRNA